MSGKPDRRYLSCFTAGARLGSLLRRLSSPTGSQVLCQELVRRPEYLAAALAPAHVCAGEGTAAPLRPWLLRLGVALGLTSLLTGGLPVSTPLTTHCEEAREDTRAAAPGGGGAPKGRVERDEDGGSEATVEEAVAVTKRALEERRVAGAFGPRVPKPSVAAKGQQVSIRFLVKPECDIAHLIMDAAARLGGLGVEITGSDSVLAHAWNSAVARQIALTPSGGDGVGLGLSALIFIPLLDDSGPAEVEFLKVGVLTPKEVDAVASAMQIASSKHAREANPSSSSRAAAAKGSRAGDSLHGGGAGAEKWVPRRASERAAAVGKQGSLQKLREMGVKIYGLVGEDGKVDNEEDEEEEEGEEEEEEEEGEEEGTEVGAPSQSRRGGVQFSWGNLAGYEEQKAEIEDTVLLALQRPDVYDGIARGTRRKFESNRPRAVLFEGPPGTGKTSSARAIASQARVPLLYVPLEAIASKYYGESERLLSSIFAAGSELPGGAIVFLDEVDALATARDSEMHEATRRTLSVLLRQMDGFERDSGVVVIAATNRKEDLDPALLSRFDASIKFGLPDQETRKQIAAQYARHLSDAELATLASACDLMSGRDIRDVCEQAERRWASKLIREGHKEAAGLPVLAVYLDCASKRAQAMADLLGAASEDGVAPRGHKKGLLKFARS